MSVDVQTNIVIAVPRDQVAAYAADPSNTPEWYVNIKSVDWETEPPVQIGTRTAFIAHFLGRKLSYTYEVVEFDPTTRLVMRTSEGPFPMETSYEWKTVDGDKTQMTLRNQGIPVGFSRLMAPFMSRAMRRANQKDLKNLKQILEARSAPE
jgi:uncharacterized membrane protein